MSSFIKLLLLTLYLVTFCFLSSTKTWDVISECQLFVLVTPTKGTSKKKTPKKGTSEKSPLEKAIKEVKESSKTGSSSELDDVL